MKNLKTIDKIFPPPPFHWVGDGFKVHTFFPSADIDQSRMSPFYLLDYNAIIEFPPSKTPKGVGPHPHRGFETVTIAYKGKVAHHDSKGNSGVIHEGDVQWMTAGSGILHKEYHEDSYSKNGGLFQMVQLWVNLPSKHKMTTPNYQTLTNDKMGKYELPNSMGVVNIIAGDFMGVNGSASTFTPMHIYDIRLNNDADLTIDIPSVFNTGILVLDGSIQINKSKDIKTDHFTLFNNDGNIINITSRSNSKILILSGKPIDEPIFQYGPFLMNTKSEIIKAFDDYNNGNFGHLD